jgi:hypothetical protein
MWLMSFYNPFLHNLFVPPPPATGARGLGSLASGDSMSEGLLSAGFGNNLLANSSRSNALAGFGSLDPGASLALFREPAPVLRWHYVRGRFSQLLETLKITFVQAQDGETKHGGVRACLNRHYWGTSSATDNSMLIGSWGKQTRRSSSNDIDVLFLLPPTVYHRFEQRSGNRQSQLLQEIKDVLVGTYPQTKMRGDGQVVVVPFNTIPIEVSPGFRCQDGSIIVCDANNGGRYIGSTAEAETRKLATSDARWNGNTRALVRMMKQWKETSNAPIKSFHLERIHDGRDFWLASVS